MDKDPPPPRTVLQPNILPGHRETGLQSLAVLVVVVGALYFGRDVFVPLALAGLLSFALAPLIAALRRRGIPRIPAVITVVMLAFLGISVFGFVVAGQVSELGASLPRYEYNIREKIRSVQSSAPGGGLVERAAKVLRDLRADIEEASETAGERGSSIPARAGSLRTGSHPGSNPAARPSAPANAADHRRAADRAVGDHGHRHRLRGVHAAAEGGPSRPLHQAGRHQRSAPDNPSPGRRCRARGPIPADAAGRERCLSAFPSASACG